MKTRLAPALTLFVLTPLIAEYLLGSLTFSKEQIAALPVMCLLYGGGAVLIREAARATKRGWPAIVVFGLAYALLEEGLSTQSLFNPHYLHLNLLDYGFIPAFGMGANWTLYVLSLHVIWSVCVPIAVVEALFPRDDESPWLGWVGRSVFAVLLLLGVVAVAVFTHKTEHFVSSAGQIGVTVGLIVVLIVLALRLKHFTSPRPMDTDRGAPNLGVLVVFALVLGSAFSLTQSLRGLGVWWIVPVLAITAIDAIALVTIARWSTRKGWSPRHRFALAAGGVLVYCWFGYSVEVSLHGRGGLVPHTVLMVAALALIAFAYRRVSGVKLN